MGYASRRRQVNAQPERRAPMIPPGRNVPPAVAQVVIEWRALLSDIRAYYNLERRGKDTSHERAGEPV
jgi:hypothetical protein